MCGTLERRVPTRAKKKPVLPLVPPAFVSTASARHPAMKMKKSWVKCTPALIFWMWICGICMVTDCTSLKSLYYSAVKEREESVTTASGKCYSPKT